MQKFSSDKLACLINCQKPHGDKSGLGFSSDASTSQTPFVTKDKISFVSSTSCVKTALSGVNKGKGLSDFVGSKSKGGHPPRRQPSQSFVLSF